MVSTKYSHISFGRIFLPVFLALFLFNCKDDDQPLAPYDSVSRTMTITVYDTLSTPVFSWLGGYVAAMGVNRGSRAILDTSLIWMIESPGNSLRFPLTFGQVPSGAIDRTTDFGGTPVASLQEDETYTYWIMKRDAWDVVRAQPGKLFLSDSALTNVVENRNDTLYLNLLSHSQRTGKHDRWITVYDVRTFGTLATIDVQDNNQDNNPLITFTIRQAGVTDSMIAAIGIGFGGQYSVDSRVWEVLSVDTLNDTIRYGEADVISSPLVLGQQPPRTQVFAEYPANGLQRNRDYYLWIANKNWDGRNRARSTPNYAFVTFKTR